MSEYLELFPNPKDGIEIDESQAELVTHAEEGQFSEAKSKEISPAKVSRTISAFANTDGGDLYIGITEQVLGGNVKKRLWDGFPDIEAANGHLQAFEKHFPLGKDFQFELFRCPNRRGLVLHVQVIRSTSHTAMKKEELWKVYVGKNPIFENSESRITFTSSGLKKFFETTYDAGHTQGVKNGRALESMHKPEASDFDKLFSGILGK